MTETPLPLEIRDAMDAAAALATAVLHSETGLAFDVAHGYDRPDLLAGALVGLVAFTHIHHCGQHPVDPDDYPQHITDQWIQLLDHYRETGP